VNKKTTTTKKTLNIPEKAACVCVCVSLADWIHRRRYISWRQ